MGFWEKAILKKRSEGEALTVAKAAFPLELPLQATQENMGKFYCKSIGV